MKDTSFLCVRHRGGAAGCHEAVEGHLQSVAVGGVIEESTQEAPAGPSLHHVTVKGSVGLEEQTGRQTFAKRDGTSRL